MRKPTSRFHFTKKALDALEIPATGRVHHYDAVVRDLGLRVEASGRKSFFWFRKVNGTPRFKALGTFPATTIDDARGAANRESAARDQYRRNRYEGDDPFERPRASPSFADLVEAYIVRHLRGHAKNPAKAEQGARWSVDTYLSMWKPKKLVAIKRKDVANLHTDLSEKHGHTTANRTVELVRALFNFAVDADLYGGANPAARIKMNHEPSRTRFLDGDELARLFRALRKEPSKDLRDYVNLALWTGARKSDLLAMRWQDLALDDNRWVVPNPKSRTPYVIALTPEAVAILKGRKNKSLWVFPGVGKSGHVVDLKRPWKLLLKRAKLTDLRQHDLRRTLGSWQAAQGTSLQIIGKSLGHASVQATQIYARLDLDPVRESVNAATAAMILASKRKPKRLAAENRG